MNRQRNFDIKFNLNDMKKIIQRNLPLSEKYSLVGVSYVSLLDGGCVCDNCNKPISNIATIRGKQTGRAYMIGLDCLDTILENNTLLDHDDYFKYQYSDKPAIQRAKTLRAKIVKSLKTYPEFSMRVYIGSDSFGFDFYKNKDHTPVNGLGWDYTYNLEYKDLTMKYINGLCPIF